MITNCFEIEQLNQSQDYIYGMWKDRQLIEINYKFKY